MELYNNYLVDLLRPIDWQGTPPRMPFCVEGNGGEQRGEPRDMMTYVMT